MQVAGFPKQHQSTFYLDIPSHIPGSQLSRYKPSFITMGKNIFTRKPLSMLPTNSIVDVQLPHRVFIVGYLEKLLCIDIVYAALPYHVVREHLHRIIEMELAMTAMHCSTQVSMYLQKFLSAISDAAMRLVLFFNHNLTLTNFNHNKQNCTQELYLPEPWQSQLKQVIQQEQVIVLFDLK